MNARRDILRLALEAFRPHGFFRVGFTLRRDRDGVVSILALREGPDGRIQAMLGRCRKGPGRPPTPGLGDCHPVAALSELHPGEGRFAPEADPAEAAGRLAALALPWLLGQAGEGNAQATQPPQR